MLNKFKSFIKGNQAAAQEEQTTIQEEQVSAQEEQDVEISVEAVMDELVENGEVVEDMTALESIALDVMGVLKLTPILFKRVMRAKPEEAYQQVVKATDYLSKLSNLNETLSHDRAVEIIADFKKLEEEIEKQEVGVMTKIKMLLSVLLYEAGAFIVNTGLFVMDTAGIITVFALRMVGHLGQETRWACREIGKSFNHRMIEPYRTK